MTDKLPPNLLKLFAPRPPLPYIPPLDKDPSKRKGPQISGISQYTELLKNYDSDYVPWKSLAEKKKERMESKKKAAAEAVEEGLSSWNPENDEKIIGDPFCVLFVGRLSYNLTEDDLRREFDLYGPIKNIRLVRDQEGKSRGYAFIEYEREKDMRAAYKDADGLKLDGRRVLVDVERGRTVKGWKPRRLGGGLGNSRNGASDQNSRNSGRNALHDETMDTKTNEEGADLEAEVLADIVTKILIEIATVEEVEIVQEINLNEDHEGIVEVRFLV
ncbi:hypothetical protein Unana1_07182 [Umbelopsis nana]